MSEPTIPIDRCILYAEDFADPDMDYTPSEPVRRAILAHLRQLQALEGALKPFAKAADAELIARLDADATRADNNDMADVLVEITELRALIALASQGETHAKDRERSVSPSPAQWPSDDEVERARAAFYPVFMASMRIGNGEVDFTIVPALRAALISLRPPPAATASIAPKGGDDLAEWIAESAILQTAEEAYDAVVPQDWDWGCYQPALLAALVAVYPLIEACSAPPADERVKGLVEALEPFAKSAARLVGEDDKVFFGWTGKHEVTLGDFRRAQAALSAITEAGYEIKCDKPSAVSPSAWLPIETAPRDGTDIILYAPPNVFRGKPVDERATVGHWTTDEESRVYLGDCGGECRCPEYEEGEPSWISWDGGFLAELPPTHWMPLPAPPDLAADGSSKIPSPIHREGEP